MFKLGLENMWWVLDGTYLYKNFRPIEIIQVPSSAEFY